MKTYKLLLIIFLFGCNSDVLNRKNNTNNTYTNIYIGDPEDLKDGPCCQSDLGFEEDYAFSINAQPPQSDSFTFRGWGDCQGQCLKDIEACAIHYLYNTTFHENPDTCKTYSCGAFGIAYISMSTNPNMLFTIGYPGAISPTDPIKNKTIRESFAYGQYFCEDGEYEYYNELNCYPSRSARARIRVPKTDYPYPHEYLFKDVYQCTNEITYVLDTSNDDYYGLKNYNPAENNKVERTREDCLDGIDNDGDNFTDCDDFSCRNVLHNECND